MGFYSIYKILKDMIRTLFGKSFLKLIIFTILILLVLFFLNSKSVFALSPPSVTYNQESHCIVYNNVDYKINDDIFTMPYLLFFEDTRKDSYNIRIIAASDLFFLNNDGYGNYKLYFNETSDVYFLDVRYYSNNLPILSTYTLSDYNHYTLQPGGWIDYNYISQQNILYLNFNIYDYYNQTELLFTANAISTYNAPSLSNSISDLENLSFNNFIINANDFTQEMISNPDEPLVMLFYNRSLSNSQNTDGLYPIKEKYFYKESIYFDRENSTDSNYIFQYPIFKTGVFFNIGSTYEIKLAKLVYLQEYNTWGYDYFPNSYTFTVSSNVTQDYINQLNQQTATTSDEEQQQELQHSINKQTESIDNINNSITDSNVDNSSIDLPTDNTQNPTQSGIDNIFQTIYNGFTSGTPQDIVFPLPYSSNNITIKPNYITQMLNSSERRKNCLLSYSSFLLVRDK